MAQEVIGQKTPNNAVAKIEKDITDSVMVRLNGLVTGKQIMLPANYSPENALKEAFLIIKKTQDKDKRPALDVCTSDSIANSLLDMCIQGLNPVKKQCYFIVWGKELQLSNSYFGYERALKNVMPEVKKVPVQIIYEGDEIEWEVKTDPLNADLIGERVITKHVQKFENLNKQIVGIYGYVVSEREGKPYVLTSDVMTTREVFDSWRQSKTNPFDDKGNLKPYSTHAKFPVEMTKKTFISRLCKRPLNTSDDSALYREAKKALLRTVSNDYADNSDIEGEFEEQQEPVEQPNNEQVSNVKESPEQPKKGSIADMFKE
nr:RecT family recombinase [uncultured Sphaerochaeta sp.]